MLKLTAIVAALFALQPAPKSPDLPLSVYKQSTLNTFTILSHPDAIQDDLRYRRTLAALTFDLDNITRLIPADALTALHSVRIVITPVTTAREGLSGRGMCYHESAGWLTANGYDAAREGVVEILNMDDFLTWRAEQPMMLLHEFAHAYHAMIGFEHADIQSAFTTAVASGKYKTVRHALLPDDKTRPAYAASNVKEYFAELTEAFFGRNDYEPFTHDALLTFDPQGAAAIDKAWRLSAEEIDQAQAARHPANP